MSSSKTLTKARSLATQPARPVRLVVTGGPDLGAECLLEEGTAVVGTRADCDLTLTDPKVSRRHLSVEFLGQRVRMKDLGSKNGTLLLGSRLESADVPVGAMVHLGDSVVAVLPREVGAAQLSGRTELVGLCGRSVAMRRLFAQVEAVAASEAPVLIAGETGAGKESVARAIHELSPRRSGPLRAITLGGSDADLLGDSLFGHVKGAFTGAARDLRGALEEANGGTLLLDEVSDLPLAVQPSLLRALDTKTFTRLGDTTPRRSDFRVLATTHADLSTAVEEKRFRRDLYHRLAAIVLEVPPLRNRREDIPFLATAFAQEAGGKEVELPPETMAWLVAHAWPGNVRELRNTVVRMVTLGEQWEDAPASSADPDFHRARQTAVDAFEKSYLSLLLKNHRGSVAAAAREARIARSYFYRLLEQHGIARKGR